MNRYDLGEDKHEIYNNLKHYFNSVSDEDAQDFLNALDEYLSTDLNKSIFDEELILWQSMNFFDDYIFDNKLNPMDIVISAATDRYFDITRKWFTIAPSGSNEAFITEDKIPTSVYVRAARLLVSKLSLDEIESLPEDLQEPFYFQGEQVR